MHGIRSYHCYVRPASGTKVVRHKAAMQNANIIMPQLLKLEGPAHHLTSTMSSNQDLKVALTQLVLMHVAPS